MNVTSRGTSLALGCLIASLLTACGGDDGSPAPAPAPAPVPAPVPAPPPVAVAPLTCQQLAGSTIPASAIGLPTRGASVTSATVVAAAGTGAAALPEYCRVVATIASVDPAATNIVFNVALPTTWNSKVVMFGGGGFDGSVPNVAGNVPNGPTDQLTPLGRATPRSRATRAIRLTRSVRRTAAGGSTTKRSAISAATR